MLTGWMSRNKAAQEHTFKVLIQSWSKTDPNASYFLRTAGADNNWHSANQNVGGFKYAFCRSSRYAASQLHLRA
jgi:hypothetical protein